DSGQSSLSPRQRNAALEAARGGSPLTEEQKALVIDPRTERLSREAFRYDASQDAYICPNGSTLKRIRTHPDVGASGTTMRTQYRSDQTACAACPLRAIC